MSGRIQVQVWYHDDRNELVVNLLAADDLAFRDEGELIKHKNFFLKMLCHFLIIWYFINTKAMGFGKLPEAYAKVNFAPKRSVNFFLILYV